MSGQEVFKALADPSRRKILKLLQGGPMTAGAIAESFEMTKGALSHHFNVLKGADLIRCERRGQQQLYSLNTTVFQEVARMMLDIFRGETAEGEAP